MGKFSTLLAGAAVLIASQFAFAAASPTRHTFGQRIARQDVANSPIKSILPVKAVDLPARAAQTSAPKQKTPIQKAPMRVTPGGSNLFGFLDITHETGRYTGLFEFEPDGSVYSLWRSPFSGANSLELTSIYYREGLICATAPYYNYGYMWGMTYYEIDYKTGQIVNQYDDENGLNSAVFYSCAYDSDTKMIYGYGTDELGSDDDEEGEATHAFFLSAPADKPTQVTIVKNLGTAGFNTQCISMCYNEIDKKLYGVTINNDFVTIDPATGNQTKLFHINMSNGAYISGMTYSATERLFYWNANFENWTSGVYTINAETQEVKMAYNFSNGDLYSCLFIAGQAVSAETPMRPEFVSSSFPQGATTGTVSYRMPTILADGSEIAGNVTWTSYLDGAKYASGTAAPGEVVAAEFKDLATGTHKFAMTVTVGGKTCEQVETSLFVGFDFPQAPTNVQLTEGLVKWAPVSKGIHGGYVDQSDLEYEVFLNSESLGKTTKTQMSFTMPELPVQKFTASVVATSRGQKSEPGVSNFIVAGEPWTIPVDMVASEETYDLMTITDGNNDEVSWWYDPEDEGFYSQYSDTTDPDDWLFLPAIEFPDASKNYSFYISCMKVTSYYPEDYLEVMIGTYPSPDHMTDVVIPKFSPQSRDYAWFENLLLKVPAPGAYYIGLHATGAAKSQLGILVHEVRVEDNGISANSPAKVQNLEATPADKGALSATVSFNMPTLDLAGNKLASDATITAVVTADEEKTVTGKPGDAMSLSIRTVQGDNTISVQSFLGDQAGATANVNVFTGVIKPGVVKNLKGAVSEDMMSIDITWDPAESYMSNGYYDPATVDYILVTFNPNTQEIDGTLLMGTGITSYTYTLPTGAEQNLYTYGVVARNAAGDIGQYMRLQAIMGTPLRPGMIENFSNSQTGFNYDPWMNYSDSYSIWRIYPIAQIADAWSHMEGNALCGFNIHPNNTPSEGKLGMPRFSTKGEDKITVRIHWWTGFDAASVRILASTYDQPEAQMVTRMPLGDDWEWTSFDLKPEYLDLDWVQLYIEAKYRPDDDMNYCIISEIQILDSTGVVLMQAGGEGNVTGRTGCVELTGFEGKSADIFSIDGKRMASLTVNSDRESVALDSGIYIVRVADKSFKVIVR